MDREPVPSAIVTRLLEAAKECEEWAVEHGQANLTEHEQGVLQIFRRVMGPVLGAVLERALQLDHPAARRQRAACPGCGCRVGNGLPDTDPMAHPPVLEAPSYVASRAPVGEFGPLFLGEAARRGVLEVVDWTQPANIDPRLRLVGPAEAQLRSIVVLGDGARWMDLGTG